MKALAITIGVAVLGFLIIYVIWWIGTTVGQLGG